MGARPPVPALAGTAEAAEALGVTTARIYQLARDNPLFPAPLAHPSGRPVWALADIEAFADGQRPPSQHPPIDLIGAKDAADVLDVHRDRITQLIRTTTVGFPDPAARLRFGPVWHRQDMLEFLMRWRRRPGPTPAAS